MEWYRHGRRVSPILNRESKKLILPLGRHVSVGKLEMIPWNKEEVDNTNESSAKRLDKGGWKLVHPSEVREITTRMETPQGYESYILTTRIAYEGPWEIWTVTSKDDPVRIWFYFDNWSIGPLVDEEHQTLGFSPVGNFGASATT